MSRGESAGSMPLTSLVERCIRSSLGIRYHVAKLPRLGESVVSRPGNFALAEGDHLSLASTLSFVIPSVARDLPLWFSLSIDGLVPAVPHKSLCRTHAPYTPAAARLVIRLLTGLSQET
jgi:hypothetical protein